MNILPKKCSDFKEKKYWNQFFSKLKDTKQQYFEWYGEYADFETIFPQLFHHCANLFNVGCGKSVIAQQIKKNYPKLSIVNCDYSEDVINDMKKRTSQIQYKTQYIVFDMLKPFNPQQKYHKYFDIIFDKGTLDAILPEDDESMINIVKNIYFKNIEKMLSYQQNAKYIIISMLQPHVLHTIMSHFENKYRIDIYECLIRQSTMQPFIISIKPKNNDNLKHQLHYLNKNIIQYTTEQLIKQIKQLQLIIENSNRVQKLIPAQHFTYNVYDNQKRQRYQLEILDHSNKQLLQKNTCSVFIAPQGKQNSFLYGNQKGLEMLHDQVKASRMIVVKLMSGNIFKSLQEVKKQMNDIVPSLVPKSINIKQIPYLTDGDEIGQRQYLYQDDSIIIEEIMIDGQPFRRLLLKQALSQTQTQYKLAYCSANNNPHLKDLQTGILPKKKNLYVGIDKDYSNSEVYLQTMTAGILGFFSPQKLNNQMKILCLGGGGCSMPKYLFEHYQGMQVTVIQLNKSIVKVAHKYFQLPDSLNFKLIQGDAYQYVQKLKDQKFDAIVLDINGDQSQPSPPSQFLQPKFLDYISKMLQDHGVFGLHLIRRQPPSLEDYFNYTYMHKDQENLVNILFCLNQPLITKVQKQQEIITLYKDHINYKPRHKLELAWAEKIISEMKLIEPKVDSIFRKNKVVFDEEGILHEQKNKKKKKNKKK